LSVDKVWVFGEPPLPTVVELAGALRDLTDTVQSLEHSSPELEALVQTVRDAQQRLAAQAPTDLRPRVGDDPSADRRVYVDHGYGVGDYNPCFPQYTLELDHTDDGDDGDDGAHGTVEFPISYEGPPGLVHGGFLAVFFDCVFQELNCALGLAGKTAELSVRFRRPTPLLTPLTYRAERIVEDRRITGHAELLLGDDLLCEAHLLAAKGDRAALPATSPRRP
jgi:acyl-coenzyme A thioesterase PaaI-like protein